MRIDEDAIRALDAHKHELIKGWDGVYRCWLCTYTLQVIVKRNLGGSA